MTIVVGCVDIAIRMCGGKYSGCVDADIQDVWRSIFRVCGSRYLGPVDVDVRVC